MRQRHGSGDEDESDEEVKRPKGKGKETVVDVDMDEVAGLDPEAPQVKAETVDLVPKKRKSKASKKVSIRGSFKLIV